MAPPKIDAAPRATRMRGVLPIAISDMARAAFGLRGTVETLSFCEFRSRRVRGGARVLELPSPAASVHVGRSTRAVKTEMDE